MILRRGLHIILPLLLVLSVSSCQTYYQKTKNTEKALVTGEYSNAKDQIQKSKFLKRKRNSLLYHLELGKVCHLQGSYEESNFHFNEADRMMEEYRNGVEMAVGVVVNPAMQTYQAETHEQILVHYYKSLNYLYLGEMEDALVEVRRLNLKQESMSSFAKGKKHKYYKDPFGLMLMGMIYEAEGEYNDAFIAYRNAYEVYESDQTGLFSQNIPSGLLQDMARMGGKAGISDPLTSEIKLDGDYAPNGELILFWETGLAPVKTEENIIFSLDQNQDGYFFRSDDMNVPVDYDFGANDPNFKPSDLGIIRLAYSKYIVRNSGVNDAQLAVNGVPHKMELGADISALAFQIEKDNQLKKLAKNLLRISIKKASELAVAQENEYAGMALGITNAFSEKADTRNWQSLPSQIQFARIPLKKGMNHIELKTSAGESFQLDVEGKGRMVFKNLVSY
jgi:tetratricopeptide (TPR) repeat protein